MAVGHFGYAVVTYDNDSGFHARFESVCSERLYTDNANEVSMDGYVVSNFRASTAIGRER